MRRLTGALAVLSVCVLAGLAGALVSVPDAEAFHAPSPYQSLRTSGGSSQYAQGFRNVLRGTGTSSSGYGALLDGQPVATKNAGNSVLYRARVGARYLPRVGLVATRLSLLGTAGYIGWRVYQHFYGGSTETIDVWLDTDTLGKNSVLSAAAVPTTFSGENQYYYWELADWVKTTGSRCSPAGTTDCFTLVLRTVHAYQGYISPLRIRVQGNQSWGDTLPNGTDTYLDFDQCEAAGISYGANGCYGAYDTGSYHYDATKGLGYMSTRTQTNIAGALQISLKLRPAIFV